MSLHVLLDLDGTLTDPAEGITRCLAFALEELAAPVPERDALTRFIGPPLRETFAELLGTDDGHTLERAVDAYRERFATRGMLENRLYPRMDSFLVSLVEQGMTLFLATSKPTVYAVAILEHFDLHGCFAGVYGAGLDGHLDDKSELLAHLLSTEGIDSGHAVMIGDRYHDMIAARANSLLPIGVLWGYGSEQELSAAGAHSLCASLEQLESLLVSTARTIDGDN